VGQILRIIAGEAVNVLGVVLAITYAGLVMLGYATEGLRYQLKFDWRYPLYSIKRLLVGVGIRIAAWTLRIVQFLLNPLFEASAEVGDWVTERAGVETKARYRSRFI